MRFLWLMCVAPMCLAAACVRSSVCAVDGDCPLGARCSTAGTCVGTAGGEGEGEGEGEVGEGEGAEGEGNEGEGSEGEGSEGEGEGAAEGEGEGQLDSIFVVARFAQGGAVGSVHIAGVVSAQSAGLCPVHVLSSDVIFVCPAGFLGGDVNESVTLNGAVMPVAATVRVVPSNWLDVGRAQRVLVTFAVNRLLDTNVEGDPVYVSASSLPPGALDSAALPAFEDDGGHIQPIDVDSGGAWTAMPSPLSPHWWLYFTPATGTQPFVLPPAFSSYSAVFHFGSELFPSVTADAIDPGDALVNTSGFATAPGVAGTALDVSGVAATGTPSAPVVSADSGTMSAWLNTSTAGAQTLLYSAAAAAVHPQVGGTALEADIALSSIHQLCEDVGADGGSCDGFVPVDDQWHQVAVAWDSTSASFFVDGALLGSSLKSSNGNQSLGDVIAIGGTPDGATSQQTYTGLIDEVRFAPAALPAGAIELEYQGIANKNDGTRRFSEAVYLVTTVTIPIGAGATTPTVHFAAPGLSDVDQAPVTVLAFAATQGSDLVSVEHGLGVDDPAFGAWNGAKDSTFDGDVGLEVFSQSGLLDVSKDFVLNCVDANDVSQPIHNDAVIVLAVFAGAAVTQPRTLAGTILGGGASSVAADQQTGAIEVLAAVSDVDSVLDVGGTRLAQAGTSAVHIDVFEVPADNLVPSIGAQAASPTGAGVLAGFAVGP